MTKQIETYIEEYLSGEIKKAALEFVKYLKLVLFRMWTEVIIITQVFTFNSYINTLWANAAINNRR